MARESLHNKTIRADKVCRRLDAKYGPVECFLDHATPFRLTIAVLLSAQTTDEQVNKVTPALFSAYPTPEAMAQASPADIEAIIRPLGFYRMKARHCVEAAQMIVSEFGGEVPHSAGELMRLPGVGRKTANIVLNVGFDIVEGIAVDTHVLRISHRLELSAKAHAKDALKTEADLLKVIPKKLWKNVNHQWILHGRETCTARNPRCDQCIVRDLCPTGTVR